MRSLPTSFMIHQGEEKKYKESSLYIYTGHCHLTHPRNYISSLAIMISLTDVYHVVVATIPLYIAMMLGYVSLKWWKLFTPAQSSGINKFVAKFSIPLLSFHMISTTNPYEMNVKLVCADLLQKALAFFAIAIIARITSRASLRWVVTGISLSTLPNTLILGIPILRAMYGNTAGDLVTQIVVLQSIIWYNILLFLFELGIAKEAYSTTLTQAAEELESQQEASSKEEGREINIPIRGKVQVMPILLTVGRKLITNLNTHATVWGLVWASIHFKWNIQLPLIVSHSISILSDGGLGMAMFSLGLFMASQTSIIACGTRMAILAMVMKFVAGPILMAASSTAIGLRGTVFKVAIVQAALPQGIVPFVFAKEYNIYPDILSTGVIFGMIIALPVALAYYSLLSL
ncbi:probable auxin efflux carrier component 8 [Impatiens glandulifera]|uniref:probable auxin efflux carrier component 8 n=1 Tax=Impatiens glandulifera TaxID=253017 RepID=UPI001FB197E0|nr:probable auxin efflux carrier component 8 [Impatiens glandulifera]